jgi:AbrB family looped-hinge helix DNA binding protein
MEITRLSTKGQVILPKGIREARSWEPGTEFIVEESGDGILLRPAKRLPVVELDDVAGCLRTSLKAQTPEQMNEAVSQELLRRHNSGRY